MTTPLITSFLAVGIGAALGAWLRWGLGTWLNTRIELPLGTLAANLIGGFLVGIAVALLTRGDYGWALAHAGLHLFGSLALTALGIATYRAIA